MSDDDMKADSTLPAQAGELEKSAIAERDNAADAAWAALAKRRARLHPIKLQTDGKPHSLGQCPDDKLAGLRLLDTFGLADSDAANLLLNSLMRVTDANDDSGTACLANGVLALLHQMEPGDAVEAMLCSQMISTHLLTMECFKRANLRNQSFEGRELNLRHGERLSRIYAQQVDALNKHRGKGQQKVTVEHVTVNAGGKAVVGNVEG
ncbi:hypothetical protein [Maricaulis sp.]|uniref:hypothetical protein n=1 Tax=Maricaulis sp. TaxID=1486257 RepID=UPI003A8F3328